MKCCSNSGIQGMEGYSNNEMYDKMKMVKWDVGVQCGVTERVRKNT